MAFNGAGTFLRLFSWQTDKTNLVPVTASRMDSEMDGIATALSTCILKDGQQTITADIPWNSKGLTGVGSLTVTGSTASTSTGTGAAVVTGGLGVGGRVSADNLRVTNQPCFSAHKNGSAQGSIANNTFTKVTFATEVFDIGSFYDTTNSRWTPPAGMVHVAGAVLESGATANTTAVLSVYKNGARYKDGIISVGSGSEDAIAVNIIDRANGTDYYELFVFATTASSITAQGGATATYFTGSAI